MVTAATVITMTADSPSTANPARIPENSGTLDDGRVDAAATARPSIATDTSTPRAGACRFGVSRPPRGRLPPPGAGRQQPEQRAHPFRSSAMSVMSTCRAR